MREKTCCFTGHRPNGLPWGYNENAASCLAFKRRLTQEIEKAVESGYARFISGMALGVDMLAAEAVLALKERYDGIKLICAVPCTNQSSAWSEGARLRHRQILARADEVVYVSDSAYFNGCMAKRNRYMVEHSSLIICGFSGGTVGGTAQTVELAKKNGLRVVTVKP